PTTRGGAAPSRVGPPPTRGLLHAITAPLETSAHRALIRRPLAVDLVRRNAATGLCRIETRLVLRPFVAFVLVLRLLLIRLAILRIDEDVPVLARRWCRRLGRSSALIRRAHNLVLVGALAPYVVRVIGVVVRHA